MQNGQVEGITYLMRRSLSIEIKWVTSKEGRLAGKLVFGIFEALAEFELKLIAERTKKYEYNENRPHKSLGNILPTQFMTRFTTAPILYNKLST